MSGPRLNWSRPHWPTWGWGHVVLYRVMLLPVGEKKLHLGTIHKAGMLHFLTCSIARLWSCKFSTSPQSFKPPTSEVRVWLVNHVTGVNNWHSSYLVWRMAWWLTSTLILTFYNLQLQCNNGLIKPSNILATWLEEDDGLETSKLSWINVQLPEPEPSN